MDMIIYLISGGLVLLGIILFFILASRRNYHLLSKQQGNKFVKDNEHIEHYTNIRDKITIRKPKVKKVRQTSSSSFNPMSIVGAIIGLVITLVVGMTVLNSVSSAMCGDGSINISNSYTPAIGSCNNGQLTGGLFSSIVPIIAVVGFVIVIMSAFGLTGGGKN